MEKYIIGINTGGTFTDAVMLDEVTGKITHTVKEPTTHQNLATGTAKALTRLIQESEIKPEQIQNVAVSSTLATNSVVENRGAQVAVIVIGFVKHFKLPVKAVVFVKGGHKITGEEEHPLELEYLVTLLEGLKNEVDAFAVCSAMSMANPSHELVTEKAISMIAPKPTFCSHRISEQAGMEERAATAALHAKLMPVMKDFINGVTEAMAQQQLTCPMVIIDGTGSPIDKEQAINNAGETVAGGPACTAQFGAQFSEQDCLVVDVGGTTTDITMLQQGKPVIARDGCQIGEWNTRVEAVNMLTGGVGGDSLVTLDKNGKIIIGPTRVTPIATADKLPPLENWLGTDDNARCIQLVDTNFDAKKDQIIQQLVEKGPLTPFQLRQHTGLSSIPLEKRLETLAKNLYVAETGFTPTDALHVLGKLDFGATQKASHAATILADKAGLSSKEFCNQVLLKAGEEIENMIITYITRQYWGQSLTSFLENRNQHPILQTNFSVKIPIIGVGAAASYLLPPVAEKLNTTVVFPENYQVGSAIGAALLCRGNKAKN